ncbi:MAG TPA: sugar transferase [Waterburya sp.]|jgi:anti-anti-sigma factor
MIQLIYQPSELDVDDTLILLLPEQLSTLESVAFKESCMQLLETNSLPATIVLDFRQNTFISSSGLGALVTLYKATQKKGIELILRNVTPQAKMVLEMTQLDQILIIELSEQYGEIAIERLENQLPETHPSVRSLGKRCLDIVGGIIGLGVTAIAFVPIAIAIKLDSPGPILFRQVRCGWMGKQFRMWKFRSMYLNAEVLKSNVANQANGAIFKNDNDPRMTRVGRFLRQTSLDELPQFWNVVKGEMSLVGTRPPTPDEVEIYAVPEWQRLDVKPGMTGEWQVNGRSKVHNFDDIIKLDLRYQHNWSLVYDLKLIIKTIRVILTNKSGGV